MIPYMISLLLIAIPVSMSEWALGRYAGRHGFHSPLGMYYAASGGKKIWGVVGGLSVIVPFVINMYYIFVESWCLLYALKYLGGVLEPIGLGFSLDPSGVIGLSYNNAAEYENLFANSVGLHANGSLFNGAGIPLLCVTAFCTLLNFLLIYRGVSKGIEKFSKRAAPLILLCAVIMIIRVVTLGNPTGEPGQSFLDGLGFMWNPTRDIVDESGNLIGRTSVWTTLLNPETWLAATAQIFYTVSLCLCAICTYASYVRPKDDIALSSLTSTTMNEFCEVVLAGLMVIPTAIMFLGARAADGFSSSFTLGFVVLPNVFGLMPLGQFCGFVFFFLLFFASVTSSMSLVQPTVVLFQESLQTKRGVGVILAAVVNLIGSAIVVWFTKNLAALDAFDFWLANFAPFFFAIFQTGLAAYVWGSAKMREEIARGSKIAPPCFLANVVKYISFPYLLIIAIFWMFKNMGARIEAVRADSVAQLSLGFFAIILVLLFILSVKTMKRWSKNALKPIDEEKNAATQD